LPIYQTLVEINANDASYWLNLGLVHLKLNDAASAVAELERSRDLDPSQGRAVSYLGLAYARCGQYASAYQAFLQAGDAELAREMEQYLGEEERARIKAAVPRARTATVTGPITPRRTAARTEEDVSELGDSDVVLVEEAGPEDGVPGDGKTEPMARPDRATAAGSTPAGGRPVIQPRRDTPPAGVVEGETRARGVISLAVEQAVPSAAAAAGAARVAVGHVPPMPLSEFATSRLIRPEDGDHTFETSAGGVLIVRVRGRVYSRTEGVNVTGGELKYEVASRHVRGSSTGEAFSLDGRALFVVSGFGHLVAAPLGEHFSVVSLDDDILYLREGIVFAFEEQVRWENGHLPGSQASVPMVQFRGRGEVAFRSKRPLLAIKLAPERVLHIDAGVLAGWIGRVVPRAVTPAGGGAASTMFVECTGEGVVLIEEEEGGAGDWSRTAVAGLRMSGGSKAAEKA
ncbi:MAG TPA: AIM24 family protein, partial [Haliangium sp.]|nr:AIM24 family protein [Haliangium sp.]